MTWIQLIDDAIKIGLSAFIGGFFSWFVARSASKSVLQRLMFEQRSKLLIESSEAFEGFFQAFNKYSFLLGGIAAAKAAELDGEDIVKNQFLAHKMSEAMTLREDIANRLPHFISAQSKLMLLGEHKCREKAENFHSETMRAWESYQFDGSSFDPSAINEGLGRVRSARTELYLALEAALKRGI